MPEYVHDQYVLQLSKAGGGGRSKHRRVQEKRKSTLMCSTLHLVLCIELVFFFF